MTFPEQQAHAPCYHGGAFFDAIGRDFGNLEQVPHVINADVLDAWFPPSPRVTAALKEHLDWVTRTSPPTASEGLTSEISRARDIPESSILVGAGSSGLIFLALVRWLSPSSRVLIMDPAYGEYAHVFENVIGCDVTRATLTRDTNYAIDLHQLERRLKEAFDLVVIVNPNNPTGQHLLRQDLEQVLRSAPAETIFWIDEAYIDYVGSDQTLERFAAQSPNVVVCKSMSKAYALSGLRAGYMCGHPRLVEPLKRFTPPWAVSLPGQLGAIRALQDPDYYQERYEQTHTLREGLAANLLTVLDGEVLPGVANYLMCHLGDGGPDAITLLDQCRKHNLFLRDISATSPSVGSRAFRIAVKDFDTNHRMVQTLTCALREISANDGGGKATGQVPGALS